jgi:hypothetical protein
MTTTHKSSRISKRPRPRAGAWKVVLGTDRVRWSKVQKAQARIASGYYERDEVQDLVVEQILRELNRH